jgi:hypothetical protein
MTERLLTESSLWLVDVDGGIVTRVPRSEDPSHDSLSYDELGAPRRFVGVSAVYHPAGPRYRFDFEFAPPVVTGIVLEGSLVL